MAISINDLKGFDFSDKYLNIHEKFFIEKNGKRVDFRIFKRDEYDDDRLWIEYTYDSNFQLKKWSLPYKNPFEIFKDIEKDIIKSENKLNSRAKLIKNILGEFNPDFDNWGELTEKLSSKVDLLKFYPNYKSSKIPQNLSKEELAKYLDKYSKYELESFFKDLSMLDFEIFYQNTWGEDYEYLIKKAFSIQILGEDFFDFKIYNEINKKRQKCHVYSILKKYGFNVEEFELMVPVIDSIINDGTNNRIRSINALILKKRIKDENIDLTDFSDKNQEKINKLRSEIYQSNELKNVPKQVNFNNLDDSLTKSKYIYVLKAISSNSKSSIVMRYKTPNEDRDDDSVQTIALNNGHIEYGNAKDNLSEYTVNELKNILKKYGLKLDGNKIHLVNRIKENLSDEIVDKEFPKKYFNLTKKGQEYLDKYYYLAEFYSVIPFNFTIDEFDLICKSNSDINPDDIIKCLVNEKWLIWDETLGEEPKNNKKSNCEELGLIFRNRNKSDNYYRNFYETIILV